MCSRHNSFIITWQFSLNRNLIELTGELHAVGDALTARQQVVEQQAEGEHVSLLVVDHITPGHLRRSETCQR